MKKRFLFLAAALLLSTRLASAESTWLTDFSAAKAKAKADNKLLLLDFTGSDWCIWCKRLKAEVFSKPQFQSYAAKNLILVELDFPRAKEQPASVKEQNMKLAEEYNIEGYPTVIILNADGKQVGTLGYMEGGQEAFIAALEKLRKT